MGTYCDQSRLASGRRLEEFNGAKLTGKYWPRFCPLEAVTNGLENSGGAGLLYGVPSGAVAASTPRVRASMDVKYIPKPARRLVFPGPPRIRPAKPWASTFGA